MATRYKKPTKADIDQLVQMYESGMSSLAIGKALNMQPTGIRRRLVRAGVKLRAPGYFHCRRPDVSTDSLIALYSAGLSSAAIAKRVGMTKRAVLGRLNERGFQMRKQSDYKHPCGPDNAQWRGGRLIDKQGYVHVWIAAGKKRLEHRVVMEKILGRSLKTKEYVHHINGIRDDNRPENLVVTTPTKHEARTLITALQRRILFLESELKTLRHHMPLGATSATTDTA
jgi:hypothetical protein